MPDNIDGIPFYHDSEYDKQLFGSLFPQGLSKPNFNKNQPIAPSNNDTPDFPDPFNRKEKIYFSQIDMEDSMEPKIFPYKIIFRKSGVDVFKDYNSNSQKNTPLDKQLIIFYEIESDKRSNFFGTACRVKMGNAYRELLNDLINGTKRIKVDGGLGAEWSLRGWAKQIAYTTKIDAKVLLDAVKLELSQILDDKNLFNTIFSLNNKLANWIYKGSEKMEDWKLTEVNYEFKREFDYGPVVQPYKPIIPVPFTATEAYHSRSEKHIAQDSGLDTILHFSANFDKILFNAQTLTAIVTPLNPIDDLLVLGLRSFYQEKLPENIQRIFNKIKVIINKITDFITAIKSEIAQEVALFNAFLCGLVNGLISLLQLVVLLIGFVIDNIPFLEAEKGFSKKAINQRQAQFEFVEDLIDTITDNISSVFKGMVKSFVNFKNEFSRFIIEMVHKIKNVSKYLVAFIVGAIAFELIFDAVVAFFTGGTSIAAEFAAKISRASSKLSKAATKIYRKVATSTSDILKLLKKEFDAFIDAIKNGKFVEWLKEKLLHLFEDSKGIYDSLLTFIGKTERIQKTKFGQEILCFVNGRVRVPVDKILKFPRGKVKNVENFEAIKKEFQSLKKIKKETVELSKEFEKVERIKHNIERSLEMKKTLEKVGVIDDLEWNKKILDTISNVANKKLPKQYGKIGLKETIEVIFEGPKGKLNFITHWEKIGYSKFWMNTIKIIPLK